QVLRKLQKDVSAADAYTKGIKLVFPDVKRIVVDSSVSSTWSKAWEKIAMTVVQFLLIRCLTPNQILELRDGSDTRVSEEVVFQYGLNLATICLCLVLERYDFRFCSVLRTALSQASSKSAAGKLCIACRKGYFDSSQCEAVFKEL